MTISIMTQISKIQINLKYLLSLSFYAFKRSSNITRTNSVVTKGHMTISIMTPELFFFTKLLFLATKD